MDKYKEAIREYEQARQNNVKLNKKRNDLIVNCLKLDPANQEVCLKNAYRETRDVCRSTGEYFSFSEIFEEGCAEGKYCKNCKKSYELKHGELAKARKLFGDAKRRLSFLGKSLLRESMG